MLSYGCPGSPVVIVFQLCLQVLVLAQQVCPGSPVVASIDWLAMRLVFSSEIRSTGTYTTLLPSPALKFVLLRRAL
eukprot:450193-Amphidinium_carterae.1